MRSMFSIVVIVIGAIMAAAPASAVPFFGGKVVGTLASAFDPLNNHLWSAPNATVGSGIEFTKSGTVQVYADFSSTLTNNFLTFTVSQGARSSVKDLLATFTAQLPFVITGANWISNNFPTTPLLTITAGTLEIDTSSIPSKSTTQTHSGTLELFVTRIPEPSSLALFGTSLIGLCFLRRKRTT